MASATTRAGYGTGAGRARGWMRMQRVKKPEGIRQRRHKIGRG